MNTKITDTSALDACEQRIKDAYNHRHRVKVIGPAGTRFGVVSRTIGWRPAYLLVHRSSDLGSWDVLGPDDRVVAIKRGNSYDHFPI